MRLETNDDELQVNEEDNCFDDDDDKPTIVMIVSRIKQNL